MNEATPTRVELRPDDRERMQRLAEEVRGRLEEMALITGRTLGIPVTRDSIRKFAPAAADQPVIEIVCAPNGPCGCYVDPPGVCEAC
jgi:hypothetical protein